MTIAKLIALRAEAVPVSQLAHDSLRYETLRGISPKHFTALHASAVVYHAQGETFEAAMDRMVDVLILAREAEEKHV